mgnify:CR=1 FL=1
MDRIEFESLRLVCPDFADIFVWGEALERLEPAGKIIGCNEVGEMGSELIVAVVVKSFDGCVLDGAVHSLDLTIGPWMLDLGGSMLAVVLGTGEFKGMGSEAFAVGDRFLDQGDC